MRTTEGGVMFRKDKTEEPKKKSRLKKMAFVIIGVAASAAAVVAVRKNGATNQ